MSKLTAALLAGVIAVGLTGCARTTTDVADGVTQHPNGVVYYDANGKLQQADKEAFSPQTQDAAETFATTVGVIGGIAGTTLGIIGL